MSDLRRRDISAIAVADVHLKDLPPLARKTEPDWFKAMARPLDELRALQAEFECPILYAGDIFHSVKTTPSLINFAIKHVPPGFAVPGNHDLPDHRYEALHHSPYWTLVEAGILTNLEYDKPLYPEGRNIELYGVPVGFQIPVPFKTMSSMIIRIAVIHAYVWKKGFSYQTVSDESHIDRFQEALARYEVAVFGDNHEGFTTVTEEGCSVINCGSLMRTKVTQIDYKPAVGLIHANGEVTRHFLDCSQDRFIDSHELGKAVQVALDIDLEDLIDDLNNMAAAPIDFQEAMDDWLRGPDRPNTDIVYLIRKAMAGASGDNT